MENRRNYECSLYMKATELRLALPGVEGFDQTQQSPIVSERALVDHIIDDCGSSNVSINEDRATKKQVVGWPPVRTSRKTSSQSKKIEGKSFGSGSFIKVGMDGAPYLRKVDLMKYKGYPELLNALMAMFKCAIGQYSESEGYNGSEYVPTYEDKESDWMLVGDVPFEMFISSCKRLRIIKGSEAKDLASNP